MKKIKVSETTGAALDWLVAKCEGLPVDALPGLSVQSSANWPMYSTDWSQGGPIIEREKLELRPGLYHSVIWACWGQTQHGERSSTQGKTGPTPLIAAMRCYVASKLGESVEVPEELIV